jgi:hypothetical protein
LESLSEKSYLKTAKSKKNKGVESCQKFYAFGCSTFPILYENISVVNPAIFEKLKSKFIFLSDRLE